MFTALLFQIHAATQNDHPALAQFCCDNPDYDVFLTGQAPDEDEWVEDFLTDVPPSQFGWTATHKLIVTMPDDRANIVAVIDVTEDMIGKGVGHIGLFQVAQRLHGGGVAQEVYDALDHWLMSRAPMSSVLVSWTAIRAAWPLGAALVMCQRAHELALPRQANNISVMSCTNRSCR